MDNSDSGSESEARGFHINKDYADKYNVWRQKEELQKLKDKYGDASEDETSSSESEDDEAEALTEKLEREWLQTLSALRRKDPKIYDKSVKFFDKSSDSDGSEKFSNSKGKKKSKKEKPYLLKDYERDLIVEKGGNLSDSESDEDEKAEKISPKSYFEEQDDIKKSFKSTIGKIIDDSDSAEEFLTKRKVSKEDEDKEAKDYSDWLKQQKTKKGNLIGIDPWDKPDLNEGEKFLRDYILNKKYIDEDDDERIPTYDEIVNIEAEEEDLEKQETFERKYNFRYEEPDQDFIKSYPRTIGESVRRKDDRRARKRQDAKEKKRREKEKKREELKQLKNLKKREIMNKIDLIKEVTGNTDIGFSQDDIDEDFDPEKYDKMMKKAFSADYYEGDEDDTKPEFSADEDLGLDVENWDDWSPGDEQYSDETYNDIHQNDRNMEDINCKNNEWNTGQESKHKKHRHKSKFAKAVARKKPVFDPNDKTFEEYLDEYYKLDYEDMIGDQPCRFRYRSVVANDFGLTTDDILTAKEKELNQWVSVKKMSQYRTREEEMMDVKIYQKKSKRKVNVLLSLQENEREGQMEEKKRKKKKKGNTQVITESTQEQKNESKKLKLKPSQTPKGVSQSNGGFIKKRELCKELDQMNIPVDSGNAKNGDMMKRKRKKRKDKGKRTKATLSDERLKAYGINPKKFKYTKKKHIEK